MINSSLSRVALRICALASVFLLTGCSLKQDMAQQPKNRPLSPSDFFTDGRSARPLVENTVPRGALVLEELRRGRAGIKADRRGNGHNQKQDRRTHRVGPV